MWRVSSIIRSQQHRCCSRVLPVSTLRQDVMDGGGLAAGGSSNDMTPRMLQTYVAATTPLTTSVRRFSRRTVGLGSDGDDFVNDGGKNDNISPSDMDFYNDKRFSDYLENDGLDDLDIDGNVDKEHLKEEAYRRRQEEISKELDARTGRIWSDPWEITEEEWMTTIQPDDLPEWSPEFVSRISQERVKVHPGTCLAFALM